MIEERVPKVLARPVQPRLHGADLGSGDLRDRLVRLVLELREDEHHSMLRFQLCRGLHHEILELSLLCLAVGRVRPISPLEATVLALLDVPLIAQPLVQGHVAAGAVAELILSEVVGDHVDPARKFFLPLEAVSMAERALPRLLGQLFGGVPVPNSRVDEVQESKVPSFEKEGERSLTSLLDVPAKELGIL